MRGVIDKLDEWGFGAWLATMIAGFIVFAPLGLAVLIYMLWSGRMGRGWGCRGEGRRSWKRAQRAAGFAQSSGNAAFDEYRDETLRRLEDEQREFSSFLEQLRMAKDKSEFDQFMAARRSGQRFGETPPDGDERNGGSVPEAGQSGSGGSGGGNPAPGFGGAMPNPA